MSETTLEDFKKAIKLAIIIQGEEATVTLGTIIEALEPTHQEQSL